MIPDPKSTSIVQNGEIIGNNTIVIEDYGDDKSKNNNNNDDDQDLTPNTALIKPSFPEVKFSNLSDRNDSSSLGLCNQMKPRKRLISNDLESAESISSSTDKKKIEIPDGGYGWVVVFSSLCISLIADGISFSFGLIYTDFLTYFGESKSKTAWVGSLFLAVPLLLGPVMSNLVDKYGCRRMTIIGGLISSSGFALASISNSVELLYLTFGIISGLGLGIGYVTAVVSIAFWFDKKRTFATGIGASGTGLGTFLYAPFTQWLIEEFCGWRGTTLILAGTMLHTCVCGCLMRDPEWLIEENRLESRSQSVTTFSNSSVCLDEIKKLLEIGAPNETVLDTLVTNCNTEANQQILDPDDGKYQKQYKSELFLPTYLSSEELGSFEGIRHESRRSLRPKSDGISRERLLSLSSGNQPNENDNNKKHLAETETLSPSEKISTLPNTPIKTSMESISSMDEGYLTSKLPQIYTNDRLNGSRFSLNENLMTKLNDSMIDVRRNVRGNSLDILHNNNDNDNLKNEQINLLNQNNNNSMHGSEIVETITEGKIANFNAISPNQNSHKRRRHDTGASLKRNISIRNSNYFRNMRVHRNSIHYRGALLNTHRYRLRASSCPNIYRNSMTTIAKEDEETWYDNFVDIMKSIFDFSLFLDPKFCIFNLSTLLLYIWFIIPYFYITEHLKENDYKEEDSAYLISIIGIFNTIGMVGLGFIGDQPWLHVTKTYAVCLISCGVSVILMPIATYNYNILIGLCIVFGFTFASTFSFTPSILVSLVDLDDFTCAYGLVLLVQGVGSLIGPPSAALIYEITSKWNASFYVAGFFIAVSGVLAYVIELIGNPKTNNDNDIENNDNQQNDDISLTQDLCKRITFSCKD